MQPKPMVYVNRITNLSDARYCAGMGADLLGFVIDPDHIDYVSPEIYREMIGWIAGPKRVAEIVSPNGSDVDAIINHYAPDYLHIQSVMLGQILQVKIPLIVETPIEAYDTTRSLITRSGLLVDYLLVTGVPRETNEKFKPVPPVLISLNGWRGPAVEFLQQCGARGLAIQGSREQSPGLKDYDHLSHILEGLED